MGWVELAYFMNIYAPTFGAFCSCATFVQPRLFFADLEGEMLYYENFDFQNVVTPVNAYALDSLLNEVRYDQVKTKKSCGWL